MTQKSFQNLSFVPLKAWFTLREACSLKGLNYKTSCNKPYLQPNGGEPEEKIGGRKMWSRETTLSWLILGDDELLRGGRHE